VSAAKLGWVDKDAEKGWLRATMVGGSAAQHIPIVEELLEKSAPASKAPNTKPLGARLAKPLPKRSPRSSRGLEPKSEPPSSSGALRAPKSVPRPGK
jgi:hypothetical protein